MSRVVVLGCGTGVGKTRVSVALLSELTRRGARCVGLKPIESGVAEAPKGRPPNGSDAEALQNAGSLRAKDLQHPLYGLPSPVSPHLAARSVGITISIGRTANWVAEAETEASQQGPAESLVAPLASSHMVFWSVVETAGGAFSPLGPHATNFDLALALEPAIWIVVAADALGVLHDVSATLEAMRARGRAPEHVVLCAAREPDASTGSNAAELASLGITKPSAVLARDDDRGVGALVERLLGDQR